MLKQTFITLIQSMPMQFTMTAKDNFNKNITKIYQENQNYT